MKLTVLSENTSLYPDLRAEYGLSMLIENGATKLLFDMGTGRAFMENAEVLGINLSSVTAAAFSHNHRDHCGGFLHFAPLMRKDLPVYVHRGFFTPKYWDHRQDPPLQETYAQTVQFVGPVFDRYFPFAHALSDFWELPDDVYPLGDGMYLVGNFPVPSGLEAVHPSSAMELPDGSLALDTFRDEQVCVVSLPRGLVVFTGCAHNGILNILDSVRVRFPGQKLLAVFGGTHLVPPNEARIAATAEEFRRLDLSCTGVCHCTGELGLLSFSEAVPSYQRIGAGFSITIE